jgi:hypothetical protein
LINFGLFGLFGLSDLEKSKSNQRIKTELAKKFNQTKKTKLNSPKFYGSVQNQLKWSVCTPLSKPIDRMYILHALSLNTQTTYPSRNKIKRRKMELKFMDSTGSDITC